MRAIRTLFFLAAIALAFAAGATPQHKLATGLWIDPNESGWGLSLFHQGNTVFGSLFVYGPDGQPRWYTAPAMINSDDGPVHDHPTSVGGDLYESTGPYFGAGTFNAGAVTRRKVGTMNIDLGNNLTGVVYTIDGVTVSKQNMVPFTFHRDNLRGAYIGYTYAPLDAAPQMQDELAITITDNYTTLSMITTSAANGSCTYSGTASQNRNLVGANGNYSCGNGRSGPWSMAVDLTPDGLVGAFHADGMTSFWSRIAASRTGVANFQGNGFRNDLWFPANEGGWGVNILEQGDTIFATLFVYDAQGRSHWYFASEVDRVGPPDEVTHQYRFVGDLYESTGPYYGTAFNPNAVTRRRVGLLGFEGHVDGSGVLTYSVDGVNVSKNVNRFAFRKNNLTGTYLGHQVQGFPDPAVPARSEAMTITIDDDFPTTRITTQAASGSCTYTAPLAQLGELRILSGTFSCTNGRSGPFTLSNVMVTWDGFTASLDGNGYNSGHMEGVRREKN
jgi:hypothetical protein